MRAAVGKTSHAVGTFVHAVESFSHGIYFGGAAGRKKEHLRKKVYVVRKKNHVVRKIFYVASILHSGACPSDGAA